MDISGTVEEKETAVRKCYIDTANAPVVFPVCK